MCKPVSEKDRSEIARLLGREPRGLEAVQVRNAQGEPSVIRVASLVDDKPFPTLFWLVDDALSFQIDQLEAAGVIKELQKQIDSSEDLQAALRRDHEAYIELRKRYMHPLVKSRLLELGYYENLMGRGIGGIANFTRVRCLHTYFAAHLVTPNIVGVLVEKRL